jgi:hypothetical protein
MIVNDQQMTNIDFGVKRSKVNVTLTLQVKTVSNQKLKKPLRLEKFKVCMMIVHDQQMTPIDFGVNGQKSRTH